MIVRMLHRDLFRASHQAESLTDFMMQDGVKFINIFNFPLYFGVGLRANFRINDNVTPQFFLSDNARYRAYLILCSFRNDLKYKLLSCNYTCSLTQSSLFPKYGLRAWAKYCGEFRTTKENGFLD